MIYIKLQGGLGNQMFEYATSYAMARKTNDKVCIDKSGITNLTHNVYSLDHFNISNNEMIDRYPIEKKKPLGNKIVNHFVWRARNKSIKKEYQTVSKLQWLFNMFGIYYCIDGYVKFHKSLCKDKYLEGYFQSPKYFNEYKKDIRREFSLKEKLTGETYNKILESNACCVHIRRGDYTTITNHLVCTIDYYKEAMRLMKEKVSDVKFFIFSDDIEWVKENIKFDYEVEYVCGNNPNYFELGLMSTCRHFILSNSSFSFWAQYLSTNDEKVVVAPNRWFNDINQPCDIYEDSWIKLEV